MEIQYNWKTRLFSNRFEIYQNDILKGELYKGVWSRKVIGELNTRRLIFETRGLFKYDTQIIDAQGEMTIGQIKYTSWKAKSTILFQNKEYKWQFDNFLRSRWSISNENGPVIKYHSNAFSGIITSYIRDEILILTGFYIRNFLKQRSSDIAAAS
ncbi:MAG: hypothetical protein A2Y71_00545 [Bacteroidetes bacterium RBG_13_42_15]|nr:MAG: hypothetical protein A2Y71_00545 [Bacteroidetes bacterium RBG_13_42_15]